MRYILLSTIPFICFIIGYLVPALLLPAPTCIMPSILGISTTNALSLLEPHSLALQVVGTKTDLDLQAGTIISQTPAAGKTIKRQQTVHIVITTRPQPTETPEYRNLTQSIITEHAQKDGIALRIIGIETALLPGGICIAQTPLPHTPLTDNFVTVYVAQPSDRMVVVPDCTHKPIEEIIEFCALQGIPYRCISPITSSAGYTHVRVTAQRPFAGSIIAQSHLFKNGLELQVE